MSPEQIAQENKAAMFMQICRRGFDSEHHHRAWYVKHRAEIEALPKPLREAVMIAHAQSTAKVFSK